MYPVDLVGVCIYVYIYIFAYTYINMYTYINVHTYACIHMWIYSEGSKEPAKAIWSMGPCCSHGLTAGLVKVWNAKTCGLGSNSVHMVIERL